MIRESVKSDKSYPLQSVERFSGRVRDYALYRPGYPSQIIDLFRDKIGLTNRDAVADIGSGTGLSSRPFLENGNPVYCVEPNSYMRAVAENDFQMFPNFRSVDGTAQNTGLESGSVNLVVAAQAFHWFAESDVAKEFERILRPFGTIAIIWNERSLNATAFLREYEEFLLKYATDYNSVRHDKFDGRRIRDIFNRQFEQLTLPNAQVLDFEGLKGRMFSSSYMPSPDDPASEHLVEELKSLFAKHARQGRITIFYDTNIFYSKY